MLHPNGDSDGDNLTEWVSYHAGKGRTVKRAALLHPNEHGDGDNLLDHVLYQAL
jgi:hypothetical protein